MYPPLEKPAQHQPAAPRAYPSAPPQGPDAYYPPPEKPTQPHPPPPCPGSYYPQPNNFPSPLPPGPQVVSGIPVGSPMNNPQHVVQSPPTQQPRYWSTGLCDCFSDTKSCCLVCWCPCVAFGQLAEIVDKGNSSCCCSGSLYLGLCSLGALGTVFGVPLGCQWIYSCTYRGKIKQDLGMPPSCCEECCVHFWCEPCALCQEYRHIQNQGYDLCLGWHGNVEKLRQGRGYGMASTVAAPVAPSMAR